MVTKAGKAAATPKPAPKPKGIAVATFEGPPDPDASRARADLALMPDASAAVAMQPFMKSFGIEHVDVGELSMALRDSIDKFADGTDTKQAERMLFGQAHALQAIFTNLARRAASQEYLKQWEAYLRMAMKAQNQCRMTLETLATIENPPVVFARQANINNGGQQQVNNGPAPTHAANAAQACASAHAANPATAQTGLLGTSDGERMDTRAAGTAGGADPHLAAVGAIDRPAHGRGQGPDGAQR